MIICLAKFSAVFSITLSFQSGSTNSEVNTALKHLRHLQVCGRLDLLEGVWLGEQGKLLLKDGISNVCILVQNVQRRKKGKKTPDCSLKAMVLKGKTIIAEQNHLLLPHC